jgi:hypothetical protein
LAKKKSDVASPDKAILVENDKVPKPTQNGDGLDMLSLFKRKEENRIKLNVRNS